MTNSTLNIPVRTIADLSGLTYLPADMSTLKEMKIPIGNLPLEAKGESATIQQLARILEFFNPQKAFTPSKSFRTLNGAIKAVDEKRLVENTIFSVTNDDAKNNGLYQYDGEDYVKLDYTAFAYSDAYLDFEALTKMVNDPAGTQIQTRLGKSYISLATINDIISSLKNQITKILQELQSAIDTVTGNATGKNNNWTDELIKTWTGAVQTAENKKFITSCSNLAELKALKTSTDRMVFVINSDLRGLWNYQPTLGTNKVDDKTIVKSNSDGYWFLLAAFNTSINLKLMGAVGDGVTDDTEIVKTAFKSNLKHFTGNFSYKVTDPSLIRNLKDTTGEGFLIHNGLKYPFGHIVDISITANVPEVFYNIQHCFDWMQNKEIKGTKGELFIKVADGQYKQNFTNFVEHKNGDKIKIVGNESEPSKCFFLFDNNDNRNFFHIRGQYKIGFINGFHVKGISGKASKAGYWNKDIFGAMVRAINGGVIICGAAMISENMYYGIQSKYGATVEAQFFPKGSDAYGGGFKVIGAGDAGIHAYQATVLCNGAEVTDTWDAQSDLGFGFCAEAGGTIECEFAYAKTNRRAGFYTLSGGSMWAHGVKGQFNKFGALCWGGHMEINSLPEKKTYLTDNDIGLYATQQGQVGANGAICSNNKQHGIWSSLNSHIDIMATQAQNNGLDGYYCDLAGTMTGGYLLCKFNGRNGLRADTMGRIYLQKPGAISDHVNNDNVKALNSGLIYVPGLPNYISTSPDRNTVNNQGGCVYTTIIS